MPIILSSLLGGLISIAGTLTGRVLLALGIGTATFTGVNFLLNQVKFILIQNFNALDPRVAQLMSYMQFGTGCSILFSAITIRLVFKGLQGDTLKSFVTR